MTPFDFAIYSLAAFRLAYMISEESGPMFVFLRLRRLPKNRSSLKEGLNCPYCVGMWIALAMGAYGFSGLKILVVHWIIFGLAIGGLSILFHQLFIWLRRE